MELAKNLNASLPFNPMANKNQQMFNNFWRRSSTKGYHSLGKRLDNTNLGNNSFTNTVNQLLNCGNPYAN